MGSKPLKSISLIASAAIVVAMAVSQAPAATQCPASMTCVPIQSGQGILQALNSTAGTGKWTELTPGTYATHEVDFPAHARLFCDTGVKITDVPGYTKNEDVFYLGNSDIIISGTCDISMPNIFPAAKANTDFSYVGNCIDIRGGVDSITLNPGMNLHECAQDGVYIREATNVLVDGITATDPGRNSMSITGQINGVIIRNNTLGSARNLTNAQIADGIDVEGNTPADYITDLTITNNNLSNNQERGLFISLWFLHTSAGTVNPPVTMTVTNNIANNNDKQGYNWSDGESGPVPHTISCSGNMANGSLIQPIPGCNATAPGTPPPPPPPPPTTPCDVNGSGAVNVTDVQICVNQSLGISPCGSGDINQDQHCDVSDVQRVVNASLGGQCVTGITSAH